MSSLKMAVWNRRHHEVMPGKWEKKTSYFDLHPLADVLRGLVYTSVLWGLLAVGVYSIYSIVLRSH